MQKRVKRITLTFRYKRSRNSVQDYYPSGVNMITKELIVIASLFLINVEGQNFDHSYECVKTYGGTFTQGKKSAPVCSGVKVEIKSVNQNDALAVCIHSLPYSIVKAEPGKPTICDYELVADCEAGFFPMYDTCIRKIHGKLVTLKDALNWCSSIGANLLRLNGFHVPKFLYSKGIDLASIWVKVDEKSRIFKVHENKIAQSSFQYPVMNLYADPLAESLPGTVILKDPNGLAGVVCQKDAEYNQELYSRLVDTLKDFNQECEMKNGRIWCLTQSYFGHSGSGSQQGTTGTELHGTCRTAMSPLRYRGSLADKSLAAIPYLKDSIVEGLDGRIVLDPSSIARASNLETSLSPIYRKVKAPSSCSVANGKASDFEEELQSILEPGQGLSPFWESERPKEMCDSLNAGLMVDNKLYEAPFSIRQRVVCETILNPCQDPEWIEKCDECFLDRGKATCRCRKGRDDVSDKFNKPKGSICSCGKANMHFAFVLDSSGSVEQFRWDGHVLPFMKKMLKSLDPETTFTIILFGTYVRVPIPSGSTKNKDVEDIIKQLTYSAGTTDTGGALNVLAHQLSAVHQKKIVTILMTDGDANNAEAAATYAAEVRKYGELLAVGVGKYSPDELLKMTGNNPANVFGVDSFEKVNDQVAKWLFKLSCD